jgi:hypothetical protein
MKNVIVCLGLVTLFFSACTKEDQAEIENLEGTWEWVSTDGGIANNIHQTPASTGNQIVFRFNANHTYSKYTNTTLTEQGSFRLEKRKCIHDHQEKPVLFFGSNDTQGMMIERIGSDTLALSDDFVDGTGSTYSRRN